MSYRTTPLATPGMPPGIPHIIGNEFAERFSFYGMRAILTSFMTSTLVNHEGAKDVMSDAEAAKWFHIFVWAVYLTPFAGALISDLWLGKYKTIIGLSIVYCLGHLALACDSTRTGLFLGLTLIAIGSGGIKPCVSAHVGDQFGTTNAGLLPRIYGWFYLSINTGSFISMLLTPWLLETYGPHVAFAVPGILMFIATVIFWMGRRDFSHAPPQPKAFLAELRAPAFRRTLVGLLLIVLFVAMFWALFDQTASHWVKQAEHMDRNIFGWKIIASQMQSINPLLVVLLIPVFSLWLYPFIGRFVALTPLRKISAGFFLIIPSFIIPAWIESWIAEGLTPSIWWQVVAYGFLTTAEVLVSTTGLEFFYTQSPLRLKSFIMSLWLFAVSLGNLFVAAVNWWIEKSPGALSGAGYYWFFVKCMSVTAVLFVFVSLFYKGRTYLQDEAERAS